jgi:hypothetical protein
MNPKIDYPRKSQPMADANCVATISPGDMTKVTKAAGRGGSTISRPTAVVLIRALKDPDKRSRRM